MTKSETSTLPALPIDPATLRPHALAGQFDMIEESDDGGAAFEGLKASIKAEGIKIPIKLYQSQVLDGRNRLKAALAVGHSFRPKDFETFHGSDADAKAYVDAANIHRRHLSGDQKERLVQTRIEANPDASNRSIAKMCGVSHTFVSKVRDKLAVPAVDERRLRDLERIWNADDLTDAQRERFVTKYAADLREMLEAVATSKA